MPRLLITADRSITMWPRYQKNVTVTAVPVNICINGVLCKIENTSKILPKAKEKNIYVSVNTPMKIKIKRKAVF